MQPLQARAVCEQLALPSLKNHTRGGWLVVGGGGRQSAHSTHSVHPARAAQVVQHAGSQDVTEAAEKAAVAQKQAAAAQEQVAQLQKQLQVGR